MNRIVCGLALLVAAVPALCTPPTSTLFEHVNVIPMDRERVLHDQSVLVEGNTITAIGPRLSRPDGAIVIDGGGTRYLSPGLADMHVHSTTSHDMVLFLANGVTTVLNMGGARSEFVDQVVRNALGRLSPPT